MIGMLYTPTMPCISCISCRRIYGGWTRTIGLLFMAQSISILLIKNEKIRNVSKGPVGPLFCVGRKM